MLTSSSLVGGEGVRKWEGGERLSSSSRSLRRETLPTDIMYFTRRRRQLANGRVSGAIHS